LRGEAGGQPLQLHQAQQFVNAVTDLGVRRAQFAGPTRSPKATFSNTLMCRNRA
jgi:hypothetical protein